MQNSSSHTAYRIKKYSNNQIADQLGKQQDDPLKISIHSSHKSPSKHNSRILSLANKNHDKFSHRSKKKNDSRTNLSSSSLSGGSRRIQKSSKIRQFANVKQLLMIKAYDKKLLKNVTGSNQANKNFLKIGQINNDPFRKQTFKVMIQNFNQITIRIRGGYKKVLDKILFSNSSAISTLAHVKPVLQKVRQQADYMHEKVKQCQQTRDTRQFRGLILKFLTFLNAAKDIQEIIYIVNKSKQRIDDLFKNLQKDSHLDQKLNLQRKKGIKKVRNAVKQYGDDGIQAQILNRVEAAINQMVEKNLQAYNKINGAKDLMNRIKDCIAENKQSYELQDIISINKIFREVLQQARLYQLFAQKFLEETDIVNDDLRTCIIRYREQVQIKKTIVEKTQTKFISNILQISFQKFQANYSICNVLDSTLIEDYATLNNLLQDICQIISNKNTIGLLKALFRDINPTIKLVEKQIRNVRKFPKIITIDTEQGLQTLENLSNAVNDYKKNVREVIQRQQRTYRQISKKRFKKQQIEDPDIEQQYLSNLIQISKKLNSQKRKDAIDRCKAFKQLKNSYKIQQLASELGEFKFYQEMKNLYQQVLKLSNSNQISTVIQKIELQDRVYYLSEIFAQVYQIADSITEKNLLKNIQKINQKMKTAQSNKDEQLMKKFSQRLFGLVIIKGLDKNAIKIINNSKQIKFPQTQHDVQTLKRDSKYLRTVSNILPEVLVKDKLVQTYTIMEQLIEGLKISQDLKWNKDNLYYIQAEAIFRFIDQSFHKCFSSKQSIELNQVLTQLKTIIKNLDSLYQKQLNSKFTQTRAQKVIQVINKYIRINKKLQDNLIKLKKLDDLEIYSQMVFYMVQYLKSTIQSFYAALNKKNQVIWVSALPVQNYKFNKFGQFVGLHELKQGQIVQKYNQKEFIGISNKKEKEKTKTDKIGEKKKNNASVDDQIDQNEMGEELNQDNLELQIQQYNQQPQDMIEDMQMQDQMGQQLNQQMDEQIKSGIQSDKIQDDLQQIEQEGQKNNKSKTNKNQQQKNKQIAQKDDKKQKKLQQSKKQQMKKENDVEIKQKKNKIILQIFKYIEVLEDLKDIISKIRGLRENFWKSLDYKLLQIYFNKQESTQIKKWLIDQLQKFCKEQLSADFIQSTKSSQLYKKILKQIDDLNSLNLGTFRSLLNEIHKQYGCLLARNKQLLRISIKNNEKWECKKCLSDYVNKNLTISDVKQEDFDFEQYANQIITSKNKFQTKYEIPQQNLQINGQQLKSKIKKIEQIIKMYKDFKNSPDGLNLLQIIVKMWSSCIHKGQKSIQIVSPLKEHIKLLQQISNNKSNVIYYIKRLRSPVKNGLQIMKHHDSSLKGILSDIERDNLYQKIQKLLQLYSYNKQNIIQYDGHAVMVNDGKMDNDNRDYKVLKQVLVVKDNNKLNAKLIKQKITSKLELYANHRKQIISILSILEIQCHIWPSASALYICQSRDQVINTVVKQVSNNVIKDAQQQLENIQQINKCFVVANHQPLIFEYEIKQSPIMSTENNKLFYKQYQKLVQEYKKYKKNVYEVGDTIFENLFGLDDEDTSITTKIFDYTETLSMLLKQKVFQNKQSVFIYHTKIQNELEEIKLLIDSQVRLLLSIIQEPIAIDPKKLQQSLLATNDRNKFVQKWFIQHQNIKSQSLSQINICPCFNSKCEKKYIFYIGNKQNHLQDYLKRLCPQTNISKLIKDQIVINQTKNRKSSITIHINKILKQIIGRLKKNNVQMQKQFINHYNIIHFVKNQRKDKTLSQYHNKMLKDTQSRCQIIGMIQQLTKCLSKNILSKMLVSTFESEMGKSIAETKSQFENERSKLRQINVQKTEYVKFGNWAINVAGKIHKIHFYIIIDKVTKQDLACIVAAKIPKQLEQNLGALGLEKEYTLIEQNNNYKRIHLNKQKFTFRLDQAEITKAQLKQFSQQIQGLKKYQDYVERWAIGVYKILEQDGQKDYVLLGIYPIMESSLNKSQIQLKISQESLRSQMQFKVLQVKQKVGTNFNDSEVVRQLKSENIKNVELNSDKKLTGLSKWLKNQLPQYNIQKSAQKQRLMQYIKQQQDKYQKQLNMMLEEPKQQNQQYPNLQSQSKVENKPPIKGSNTSPSKIGKKQVQKYIDELYQKLEQKQIYSIPSVQFKAVNHGQKDKDINSLKQLKSHKNIQIKQATQKTIEQIKMGLNGEIKNQFERISQDYMNCISEKFLLRENILKKVIKSGNQLAKDPNKATKSVNPPYSDQILKEISTFTGYVQSNKQKYMQAYNNLEKQNKQTLMSVYL